MDRPLPIAAKALPQTGAVGNSRPANE